MITGAGVVRTLSLALLMPSSIAFAGPLDTLQPGQWYEVPNSFMRSLDPCASSNCPNDWGSQNGVINAWNSAAFDTLRNRLIVWGGGHSDYAGNEIYAFSVDTLSWNRITNHSTNVADDVDPYPDGRPNPRHTYGTEVYIPTIDRFWVAGGSGWRTGSCANPHAWMYNFNASPPESGWEDQGSGHADCGGLAAYDPGQDKVLLLAKVNGTTRLYEFDPKKSSSRFSTLNGSPAERRAYQTGVVDPVRRKLVVVGAGVVWTFDIDRSGAPQTTLKTSGATEIESASAPGLAYDSVSDRVVAWDGGQNVYTLNMDSLVWEKRTPTNSANPGGITASGGTWGRFAYVPSKNVFILVNGNERNVFFYKLSASTGTPAPLQPAKPNVTVR